jgi:hypothetical protein
MDEMRFGMKGVLKKIWAIKGSRPIQIKQQGFKSGYVFGAVNPQTGQRVGLVFSNVDTETFNLFLEMTSESVEKVVHIILVMDNAGYHGAKEMKVPENITILSLPPYSPELNPAERLWHWMKSQYLCNRVFKNISQILEAGCDAWNKLTDSLVQSICAVSWLSEVLGS